MYPPFSFKEHDLMLFCFSLAALKGIMPSLHNWCRYLSVGRSIPHQSGKPMALHSNMWATCPFHSPISFGWPCLPWPSSGSASTPLMVHYLPASMGIDIIPLPYICVPLEVCSQITLPVVFTHPQWMLQYTSIIQASTSHFSTPGKLYWWVVG